MMTYNRLLHEAGVLRSLDGLHPPSMGVRVTFPRGKPHVTKGPFPESKETLGGYWMIDVGSEKEAIDQQITYRFKQNYRNRPGQELADFPADIRAAAAGFKNQGNK